MQKSNKEQSNNNNNNNNNKITKIISLTQIEVIIES
jgi:hypothetical protein